MSRKAKHSPSSYTLWAGASPEMIWQKMQLGSVMLCGTGGHGKRASVCVLNPEKGHGEGTGHR